MQDHQTGNVGRIARAGRAGAAERALSEPAVGQARKDAAAVFQPNDLFGRVIAHRRGRVLIGEVIRTLDGVERMRLGGVLFAVSQRGVDAALGGARVTAHRMHLGDDRDVRPAFGRLDRRAHPCQPAADHDHVVLYQF